VDAMSKHFSPPKNAEDPRLSRLTEIALALPETTRQVYGSDAQFLVRKKTFAYFLDNHHGDGLEPRAKERENSTAIRVAAAPTSPTG